MDAADVIITQLEQAFRRKSWHGTNLLGSLRGIDHETAAWRPAPDRHNIWELIVHAAYWKYSVYRRFADEPAHSFELKGSNWFPRPDENTERAYKRDLSLLKYYHQRLMDAVAAFPAKRFDEIPHGSSTTFRDLVIGVAAHDLYHAGQIQLIKRLHG